MKNLSCVEASNVLGGCQCYKKGKVNVGSLNFTIVGNVWDAYDHCKNYCCWSHGSKIFATYYIINNQAVDCRLPIFSSEFAGGMIMQQYLMKENDL